MTTDPAGRGPQADGPDPGSTSPDAAGKARPAEPAQRAPLYSRLLRLRHLHLSGWQRAACVEGALAVAVLLVLADLATAWSLLALPLAVAVVVKLHDVVAGLLTDPAPPGTARTDVVGPGHATGAGPGGDQRRRSVRAGRRAAPPENS